MVPCFGDHIFYVDGLNIEIHSPIFLILAAGMAFSYRLLHFELPSPPSTCSST